MSTLPAEQTWLILVELLTDLRRHKVQIPKSITNDIRLAKTTINFYKVDPTEPERAKAAKQMNEFLTSAQEALMTLADERGEEYASGWLEKLKRASRGEEVFPPREERSKFVVGAPPGFSMIRVNFKIPLAEDRVQEIAEYHNVIIEFEDDRLVVAYGDPENLKLCLKELGSFFKEQIE